MVEKGRFDRIYNMIEVNFYTEYEETPENKRFSFMDLNTVKQKKWIIRYD